VPEERQRQPARGGAGDAQSLSDGNGENALHGTAPTVTPDRIIRLGYAFREAKALLSAVELGVFTALEEGPTGLDTLRIRVGLHERRARDFLDALVALGLLDRDDDGRYANTPAATLYLVRDKPNYIGGLLDHLNTCEYPHWNLLTRALTTGRPQFGTSGNGHYPDLYANRGDVETFAKAMSGGTLPIAQALAAKFAWRQYATLIDIGSAEGCLPVQIAQTHPHVTGGGFDLPPVGPLFDAYVQQHGLSNRLRFFTGDFLTDPLPRADVLVFGRVLHNWDLATKKMLLKKAHEALPIGGAVIVYERLIDDARRTGAAGLLASLNMLIMTADGFDYSGADCIDWMRETGFRDMRIEPLTGDQSMIVGYR
jgi:hypothetical protein